MHNDFSESLLTTGLSPLPICVLDSEQLTQYREGFPAVDVDVEL